MQNRTDFFLDWESALMLTAARLCNVAGTNWGIRQHPTINRLAEASELASVLMPSFVLQMLAFSRALDVANPMQVTTADSELLWLREKLASRSWKLVLTSVAACTKYDQVVQCVVAEFAPFS